MSGVGHQPTTEDRGRPVEEPSRQAARGSDAPTGSPPTEHEASDHLVQGAAVSSDGAPRSAPGGRDLEWEVTHKKSRLYKGRGSTPEAALRDLHDSFALGLADAREALDREQKRLDKLAALLSDTE